MCPKTVNGKQSVAFRLRVWADGSLGTNERKLALVAGSGWTVPTSFKLFQHTGMCRSRGPVATCKRRCRACIHRDLYCRLHHPVQTPVSIPPTKVGNSHLGFGTQPQLLMTYTTVRYATTTTTTCLHGHSHCHSASGSR